MHEVKEEHRARWGGRRRASMAGRANSGEALVRAVSEASACAAAAVWVRKQMGWRRGRQTRRGGCRRDRRGTGATGVQAVSDDDGVRTSGRRALRPVGRDAARRAGADSGHGGRAGRPVLLGRKGSGGPLRKIKGIFFLFLNKQN